MGRRRSANTEDTTTTVDPIAQEAARSAYKKFNGAYSDLRNKLNKAKRHLQRRSWDLTEDLMCDILNGLTKVKELETAAKAKEAEAKPKKLEG